MGVDEGKRTLWNSALKYLMKSRYAWWNQDYIEFLIERVWRITEPVDIIDLGCGIGFLGELLMPLLPEGSTYTGVDIGDRLIEEATKIFAETDYETHFIHADLCEFTPPRQYDIAICQAVLQHIPNPIPILEKMKECVVDGGLVIGMDISRDMCSAALYVEGFDYSKLNLVGIEQKLRRNSLERINRDFEIGLKLPSYMQKIGLKRIGVRLNDFVQYVNPEDEDYDKQYEAFIAGQYEKKMTKDMKINFVNGLIHRGLTREEAEKEFLGQQQLIDYIHEHSEAVSATSSKCMLISYGYAE